MGAIVATLAGGLPAACIVVKVDTTETLTDVSLSAILTDGFTQTSVPTGPSQPTDVTDSGPNTDTDTDTDTGPTPFCGDGEVDPGEACDDGDDDNSDGCLQTCELASCGDGFVRAGVEACDDGNQIGGDGCEPGCTSAECGDGVVQPPEQCDDGNGSNTDACLTTCLAATCGDTFVQPGEQCDDGNVSNTDACLADCAPASCGDGFVQAGVEFCDDANTTAGDGCTNCLPDGLPPECQTAVVLQDASRNVGSAEDVECDLDIPAGGQWSRFSGAAGSKMPTSAPPPFTCGTHAPGWLDGAMPAEADGIVARDVCFHWEGNTCNWRIPISALNCGPFVAFKLMPVPTCALRYCGSD